MIKIENFSESMRRELERFVAVWLQREFAPWLRKALGSSFILHCCCCCYAMFLIFMIDDFSLVHNKGSLFNAKRWKSPTLFCMESANGKGSKKEVEWLETFPSLVHCNDASLHYMTIARLWTQTQCSCYDPKSTSSQMPPHSFYSAVSFLQLSIEISVEYEKR